ncbi:MAG: InlB B-repeat-containing protein [Prevotella sp.]|nr:InlB B-repeat-containing protein [Prevotella sp.]
MKQKLFTLLTLLLCVCSGAWAAVTYSGSAPATTTHKVGDETKTFLDVANTTANAKISETVETFAIDMNYLGRTWKPAWVTGTFSPSNSTGETGTGFLPTTSSSSYDAYTESYGYIKVKSTEYVTFYVTGTTGVAIINKDNTLDSKYVQIKVSEIAEDGTVGEEKITSSNNKSAHVTAYAASTLESSKFYQVVIFGVGTSGMEVYQIRFTQPELVTHSVTYKANGGTGADIVASAAKVAACTFTAPTNMVFTGWNTAVDGSGTAYAVGAVIPADGLVLYAQWAYQWVIFDGSVDEAIHTSPVTVNGVSLAFSVTVGSVVDKSSAANNTGNGKSYLKGLQIAKTNDLSFTIPEGYTGTFTYALSGTGNRVIRLGSKAAVRADDADGYIATLGSVTNGPITGGSYTTPLTAGTYYICENNSGNWQLVELIFNLAATTPTLSGEWSATSGTIYKGDAVPTPSFSVSASNGSELAGSEFMVTYSVKAGSDDGLITITGEGSGFTLNNDATGTATLVATLASADEDVYEVETETYEYVYTVNEKVPTYTLNKADHEISLRSTPVHRAADTNETATVTMEAGFLEGTDGTVVFVEPVAGLSVSPIYFDITDGSVAEKTFTITYNSASGASGTATLRFTDGNGNTKDLLVDYASVVAHEWTTIGETTTWDWTKLSTTEVKLTDSTTPTKSTEFLLGDMNGEVFEQNIGYSANFSADALKVIAEYPVRATSYIQGNSVKFTTTVPGTVKVTFSNTGGNGTNRPYRYVMVNGVKSTSGSADGTMIESNAIAVPAGLVTISGYIPDATDPGSRDDDKVGATMLRISKIVFTATDAEQESIEIACEGGLASYTTTEALDFSTSSAEAFIVTSTGSSTASLTKVTKVPAGEGIIVKGTKGQTVNVLTTEAATDDVSGNLLKPVTAAKTVAAGEAYALSKTDGKFHPVSAGVTIPAGKAYLPGSLFASGARDITLIFEDEEGGVTTGIHSLTPTPSPKGEGSIYTLSGQKVQNPTKGLYIVNGKKVLVP